MSHTETSTAECCLGSVFVLNGTVGQPPAAAGGLVSAGNAQDVGLGQLLVECRAQVLLRVRAGDVAVTDKHRSAVKARRSRKGNHNIKVVSGIKWKRTYTVGSQVEVT